MDEELEMFRKLIDSVRATNNYSDVNLFGDQKSFEKLSSLGYPLENYTVLEKGEPNTIMTIPSEPKPIKIVLENNN